MRQAAESRFRLKWTRCNKPVCAKCANGGRGHGPYWFEYRTIEGHTQRIYHGTHSPFETEDGQPLGRTHPNTLVGRDQELEIAQRQLGLFNRLTNKRKRSVQSPSQTRFVLLSGDAGIGKTRVAEELSGLAQQQGWRTVWGRTYAQEVRIPYRLWSEPLSRIVELSSQDMQQGKVQAYLLTLSALVPELQELHAQTQQDRAPEPEPSKLWEAIYQLLVTISARQPVLIVLDDVQWADTSSCELLAYLARRVANHPIALLATCRESELPTTHPFRSLLADLQLEACLMALTIAPLTEEHIRELLAPFSLPDPLIQHIQNHVEGNPYFAEEVAKAVPPSRFSDLSFSRDPVLQIMVPQGIASLLRQRLSRLSLPCQQLLAKAAVLGNAFTSALLDEVEHATASADQPPATAAEMINLLDEAVRAGILTEQGIGKNITYHFWHQLLRDLLYEQITATRKTFYHQRIAEGLQTRSHGGRERQGEEVLRHLTLGEGDGRTIAHYAERAGLHAYQFSAYPEAEAYYQLALDSLGGSSAESGIYQSEKQAEYLELLGECTRYQGKYEDAQRWYEDALAPWSKRQPTTLEEKQQIAQVQSLLWSEVGFTCYSRAKLEMASDYYQQSKRILQNAGIYAGPAWAYLRYRQSYLCWRKGMYKEAHALASEALTLQEAAFVSAHTHQIPFPRATLLRRTLAGEPVFVGRIQQLLGLIANGAGQATETIAHWKAALSIFEQNQSKRDIATVSCNLGDVYLRLAAFDEAQACLRQALITAEQICEI